MQFKLLKCSELFNIGIPEKFFLILILHCYVLKFI